MVPPLSRGYLRPVPHAASALVDALYLALWVSLPVLCTAFVVSGLAGALQAFAKLNEPALNAIPRSLAVGLSLALSGAWMADELQAFAGRLLGALPSLVH